MNIQESNLQIIAQLAQGLPVKQIASNLGMSYRTACARIEDMKDEYEANNIAQLVVKALIKNLHHFAVADKWEVSKKQAVKEDNCNESV